MNIGKTWRSVGIGLLLLALVALLFLYTNNSTSLEKKARQEQEVAQTGTVSLTIEGLYTNKSVALSENDTVLEVLRTLDSENPQLELSLKEYSGLGTLVDGMDGKKNGTDSKYWQYKVNGVMPQIGADAFTLHTGDSIEWYFDTSAF